MNDNIRRIAEVLLDALIGTEVDRDSGDHEATVRALASLANLEPVTATSPPGQPDVIQVDCTPLIAAVIRVLLPLVNDLADHTHTDRAQVVADLRSSLSPPDDHA